METSVLFLDTFAERDDQGCVYKGAIDVGTPSVRVRVSGREVLKVMWEEGKVQLRTEKIERSGLSPTDFCVLRASGFIHLERGSHPELMHHLQTP